MCGARHFKKLRRFRFLPHRATPHLSCMGMLTQRSPGLSAQVISSVPVFVPTSIKQLYVRASHLMRQNLGPAACFYRTYYNEDQYLRTHRWQLELSFDETTSRSHIHVLLTRRTLGLFSCPPPLTSCASLSCTTTKYGMMPHALHENGHF